MKTFQPLWAIKMSISGFARPIRWISSLRIAGSAAVPLIVLLALCHPGRLSAQAWGPEDNGLQMRILPVDPRMDEQNPRLVDVEPQEEFDGPRQVTFVAEIRNNSDQPVALHGVRYTDNVSGGYAGKSATASLAHWLFRCELVDTDGNVIKGPSDALEVDHPVLSPVRMSRQEMLEPGQSMLMLLYPLQWDNALEAQVVAGEYRCRIFYDGGEACQLSATCEMIVLTGPTSEEVPELNWGEPVGPFRVAAQYRMADTRMENAAEFAARVFPVESRVAIEFHIQNISSSNVELESETWRQDDQMFLVTSAGEQRLSGTWYSGITPRKTWVLEPKETVVIPAPPVGFTLDEDDAIFDHPTGTVIEGEPGVYRLVHELRVNDQQIRTGTTDITIRHRNDNDAVPTHTFQLRFDRTDGSFADSGYIRVQHRGREEILFEGEINSTVTNVQGCTGEPLTVLHRIPGAVARRSIIETPGNDRANVIELETSVPVTLRLTDADGQPVSDAAVRYFNYSYVNAGSGPYPMLGIEGPVYGTPDENGNVTIDFLERFTSENVEQMGDKMYWFYVEPTGDLAPRFIGPATAGDELGDIVLEKLIDIEGEIHGTPEQLQNLAVEWDQPVEMLRGDGESSWSYAKSKRLSFRLEGDKAVFQLQNLRPGPFRVVGTFAERPHTNSYQNARRTAGADDWEFEVILDQATGTVVIRPDN